MLVILRSTRKTSIGMLRAGIIYNLPETQKVMTALKPLIHGESPVAKKLTEAQAQKLKVEQQTLNLGDDKVGQDAEAVLADIEQKAKAAIETAEKERDAAKSALAKAEKDRDAAVKAKDEAEVALKEATAK